uniref:Uncharacterized protein n=1 Tax=Pyramimonas orientalis virus TaxID=455367 RepID=A0A7L9AY41_POV01|nr:hypothetical protein HWQ62_00488 [Pyramimonas orientalis virus]
MDHEITFENMFSLYSKYLTDKYSHTWGLVNDDIKDESDEFKAGTLRYLKEHHCKWIVKTLYDRCQSAKLSGLNKIDEKTYITNYDKYINPVNGNTVFPFALYELFNISYKFNDEYYINYTIQLYNIDEIGQFLMILGIIKHEYGVESEKYRDRGLVEPIYKNFMIRAMLVDNIIGELYSLVEDELYHF